jgi:hypothetical protein
MPASIGFGVRAQLGPGSRLQDDLLLAPLLRNRDLLSLSATATWLRPYRNQLGGVKIRAWRDGVTPAMLAGQRRLHTIVVAGAKVLPGLAVSLRRRGEGGASLGVTLRRLKLAWWTGAPVLADGLRGLGEMLAEAGCPALQELRLSCSPLGADGASHLAQGLGGCGELRILTVQCDLAEFRPLVTALERGVCPRLQSLFVGVPGSQDGRAVGESLAKALQAYPRPALQELTLNDLPVGQNFDHALRTGACRGLNSLILIYGGTEAVGVLALAEALGEGGCPDLRVFWLEATGLGPQAAQALAQAMRAGYLACLEDLRLSKNKILDEGVVALGEALGEGACPRLQILQLTTVGMGDEGCRALARALREGGLPALEQLDLHDNEIRQDGEAALAEAVEAAARTELIYCCWYMSTSRRVGCLGLLVKCD